MNFDDYFIFEAKKYINTKKKFIINQEQRSFTGLPEKRESKIGKIKHSIHHFV